MVVKKLDILQDRINTYLSKILCFMIKGTILAHFQSITKLSSCFSKICLIYNLANAKLKDYY